MNDFVRLPRSVLDEEMWRDKDLWSLYGYLLSKADENGDWVVSLKDIYSDLKLSRQRFRTLLEKLRATTKVTTKSTTKSTTITLCLSSNKAKVATTKATTKSTTKVTTLTSTKFTPPTESEVVDYAQDKNLHFDPIEFVNFYQSKGWKIGKEPMKDWKAACRTWESRWKEKYGERYYYEVQRHSEYGTDARKESRDKLHSLAINVVSQSSDKLLSLYNGGSSISNNS